MIVLTRFSSERIAINADLVARVETNPDTRVTLIDGSRYIVTESMEDVIRLVEEHKARVLLLAQSMTVTNERTPLGIVPDRPEPAAHDRVPVPVTPLPTPRK
ncbi:MULTISPECIES: flagellar FlbD family protein [Oerskovia]|uniref:Flagellar FlbD family protein n=2 Tax=Oerskovia TaxID=162491 RepID=A0ABR8V581_9CELL|nr:MULTISPECIES: flagellar FlbD family protein [Oerskovia]MBD7999942.1 flagellar FlbD family protein [Oerskovia gallyi]MBM7496287.1 flagellar protein FlbD [Oerskovia paurometabola]